MSHELKIASGLFAPRPNGTISFDSEVRASFDKVMQELKFGNRRNKQGFGGAAIFDAEAIE